MRAKSAVRRPRNVVPRLAVVVHLDDGAHPTLGSRRRQRRRSEVNIISALVDTVTRTRRPTTVTSDGAPD
jgi:hypothetical protein